MASRNASARSSGDVDGMYAPPVYSAAQLRSAAAPSETCSPTAYNVIATLGGTCCLT